MFKTNILRTLAVVSAVTVILLFAATNSYVFAEKPTGEPIKLGILFPMTGPFTAYSHPAVAALEIAVEKINAEGGVLGRPFELIVKDTKLNPEVALREAKSLVLSDGCTFLGGFLSSANALAVSSYVKQLNGKAFLTVYCASASPVTEEHGHRYVSRISSTNTAWVRCVSYDAVKRWPDVRRVYLLNPNYVYGQTCAKEFKQILNKHIPEAKIVGEAYPPLGTKDFSGYISAIMGAKPDLIQSSLYGSDAVSFLKQAEPYGILQNMKVVDQDMGLAETLTLFKKGDVGVPIGVLAASFIPFYNDDYLAEFKGAKKFYEQVHKKSNYYPGAVTSYAHPNILKQAMEKAGTTTDLEKIINAIEGLHYEDGIYHPFTMRACDHQSMCGFYVGIIGWDKSGKFKFPIITPDSMKYVPYKGLYHTCKEVMALREAEAKKHGEKK